MPRNGREPAMANSATSTTTTSDRSDRSNRNAPLLYWTKNLFIGNALIDADHRRIFDLTNRLRADLIEQPEYSIVGELLVELIEHTGEHFMREEALMKAIRYPSYELHKLEHTALMHTVNDLHRRYMEGKDDVAAEVSDFLHKGLVPHILHADMALGRSMRSAR